VLPIENNPRLNLLKQRWVEEPLHPKYMLPRIILHHILTTETSRNPKDRK